MSDHFVTPAASLLERARTVLAAGLGSIDLRSGLARKVLIRAGKSAPAADAPGNPDVSEFRRAPALAAYGYVLSQYDAETHRHWLEAIDRLRGRDAFPGDGDSFAHNPVEVLGLYAGIETLGDEAADQKSWFRTLMRRGLTEGKFRTPISRYAAILVLACENVNGLVDFDLGEIEPAHLLLACAMTLAFAPCWETTIALLEEAILRLLLSEPVDVTDASTAAAATVLVERLIDRLALNAHGSVSTVESIVGLCRRFPLFVDQLRTRRQDRMPFAVKDEYDVQDLLHAILKLHFDDVRPEELSASFGGRASRVDFFLPSERILIEAKMTRPTLKQDKLVSELIDDTARYSKMETVDTLICLVYDQKGYCKTPKAIEKDLEASASRLKVRVIVCPQQF